MRKFFILFLLLTFSMFTYGLEFQVGPAALYNYLVSPGDDVSIEETEITLDDFTFGGEGRLQLGLLEATALGLYSPGFDDPDDPVYSWPATIELYLDAGVALDFLLLRAGIGIGPNLLFVLDENASDPVNLGANVKLHTDLVLNDISISLNYMLLLPDLSEESLQAIGENTQGLVGLSVLFKL